MLSGEQSRAPARIGSTSAIENKLRAAGMRPTRQRMLLARLLFEQGHRHLTAEMLWEETLKNDFSVSLATVYNTLNTLTQVGLLRKVSATGGKVFFDTNTRAHQHYYIEDRHELVDIERQNSMIVSVSTIPDGYEIVCVDVVVRLRKTRETTAKESSR